MRALVCGRRGPRGPPDALSSPGRRASGLSQSACSTGLPEVDCDTDAGLIRSLADRFPLVAIHIERDDADVCFIGVPNAVTAQMLELRTVTPAGEWEDEAVPYSFDDITRVGAGGRYEHVLFLVTGPPV